MSRPVFIAPIVEGHGEVEAVPCLLKRVAASFTPEVELKLNPALRVKAGSFLNDDDYFKRYIELAARKAKAWPKSCILILLDCDDDCPAKLGPKILGRAHRFRPDTFTLVVLAHREYETWFLAAAHSLRGVCGLPPDLEPPGIPESVRDAKGWLSSRMNARYNEPDHQPLLTGVFSFDEAVKTASFSRAFKKLRDFLK